MADGETGPVCGQLEIVTDVDCCTGTSEQPCGRPASWLHRESGVAMCDLHERNAQMYGGAELGKWTVGRTTVPYPDGWERVEPAAERVQLEIVTAGDSGLEIFRSNA